MAITPALILINGAPGAGKTTVALALAAAFDISLVAKDPIKEQLFDESPFDLSLPGSFAASQALGVRATETMLVRAEVQLLAGRSTIIDCNLRPEFHAELIASWIDRGMCSAIQVMVTAPHSVLIERYARRAITRHPVHFDQYRIDSDVAVRLDDWPKLPVEPTIVVDTATGENIGETVIGDVRRWLTEYSSRAGL